MTAVEKHRKDGEVCRTCRCWNNLKGECCKLIECDVGPCESGHYERHDLLWMKMALCNLIYEIRNMTLANELIIAGEIRHIIVGKHGFIFHEDILSGKIDYEKITREELG